MSNNPRRILLAVTGLSPQILTETLYALGTEDVAVGKTRFIPTEVHIITTASGAKLAKAALLHPDGGQFHALLADYPQLGNPVFNDEHIHIIQNTEGQFLSDIRSPAENASAADSITALMSKLTRDEKTQLHVSIAGGRKTMGFYLGYAFSLFARPQDELSHVLVSGPFESHPEFFFPPAKPKRLGTRDGQHIDTADATITLARIPVVRLRHGQPQALLDGKASFGDTVATIQKSLDPASLHIDLVEKQVLCGGISVKLPPAQLAWLAWWAQNALRQQAMQDWRCDYQDSFLRLYRHIVTEDAEAYEKAKSRIADHMEKEFFQENNAKLERQLKQQLGQAATPYLLASSGKRPNTKRGLSLSPQAITLITQASDAA